MANLVQAILLHAAYDPAGDEMQGDGSLPREDKSSHCVCPGKDIQSRFVVRLEKCRYLEAGHVAFFKAHSFIHLFIHSLTHSTPAD